MNNRLGTIVNLKKYPIQNLNSQLMKELSKLNSNDFNEKEELGIGSRIKKI